MNLNPKPIRIEPAFADREQVRAMFMRNSPYRALAAYAPERVEDEHAKKTRSRFFRVPRRLGSGWKTPWILLGREVDFLRQPLEFWLVSYAIVCR